ncbi:MAG: (2Fe-2S) ferredoxin domain-containing protein [Chloroflexota bacterium]
MERFRHWAFVCEASTCRWQGSPQVREALARAVTEGGSADVAVVRTGCLSLCGAGPAVVTYPNGDVHLRVEPDDAPDLAGQLAAGAPLQRRVVRAPPWYREQITRRLGYLVELLKRRLPASP